VAARPVVNAVKAAAANVAIVPLVVVLMV